MDEGANKKKVKSGCRNKRRGSEDSLVFMGSLELELFGRSKLIRCKVYAGGNSLFSPVWK